MNVLSFNDTMKGWQELVSTSVLTRFEDDNPPKLSAGFTKSNENNRQKDDESINCSWSRSCDVASRMTIPPSTY